MLKLISVPVILALALVALSGAAAASYALFGDASLVSGGSSIPTAAQLRSDSDPGYGGVSFPVPAGTTFGDLTLLKTDFNVTDDDCGGGSPRFSIKVDTGGGVLKNIFAYLGPYPNYVGCSQNTWTTSGDLLEVGKYVDTGQIPGGTFYDAYADALTNYGSYPVVAISLVVDGTWFFGDGEQTVLVDNVTINTMTETFESASSCKDDGWRLFTSSPGPFKNQGDCIQYFNAGK